MHFRFRTVLKNAVAVILIASLSIGMMLLIQNAQRGEHILLSGEELRTYQKVKPIIETLDLIEKQSYTNSLDSTVLVDRSIRSLLSNIEDAYAQYYTKEEYEKYLEELSGAYHGIGALVGQPNDIGVPVLQVYESSPAMQAGLRSGDTITHIDGTPLRNANMEALSGLFVGEDGSVMRVVLMRGEEMLSIDIGRGEVKTTRVEYRILSEYTGFIRIDRFSGTVTEEVTEALQALTKQGMKSLIIDIRNNPGGELEKVVSVSDCMLKEGNIVSVRYTNGQETVYASDPQALTDVPLAVLVNENSASASEIFAAAIKDNGRGIIVGLPTYGKGVVQTTEELKSNGGWVKLTTAAYYTPSGMSVEKTGVLPDIEVGLKNGVGAPFIDQIEQADDAQLQAALEAVQAQAKEPKD